MDSKVDNKVRFIVCIPWRLKPSTETGIERECFVCHGKVAINPLTFEQGVPSDCIPVCGSCAVDMVDGEETIDARLTDSQRRDARLLAITAKKDWPKRVMEHIREHKSEYDARSAVGKREN